MYFVTVNRSNMKVLLSSLSVTSLDVPDLSLFLTYSVNVSSLHPPQRRLCSWSNAGSVFSAVYLYHFKKMSYTILRRRPYSESPQSTFPSSPVGDRKGCLSRKLWSSHENASFHDVIGIATGLRMSVTWKHRHRKCGEKVRCLSSCL